MQPSKADQNSTYASARVIRRFAKPLARGVWRLLRGFSLGPLVLAFHPRSSLRSNGWLRSFRQGLSVDGDGAAIPWCTYPFVHFIGLRLDRTLRVFEYGCGHSTLWYAARTMEVVAVDDDLSWVKRIGAVAPSNVSVLYQSTPREYVSEILNHGQFDIVVIDGKYRGECAHRALQALRLGGVIVWDNSDRQEFAAGRQVFLDNGFKELPFLGMVPASHEIGRTTILYRSVNCLGI